MSKELDRERDGQVIGLFWRVARRSPGRQGEPSHPCGGQGVPGAGEASRVRTKD